MKMNKVINESKKVNYRQNKIMLTSNGLHEPKTLNSYVNYTERPKGSEGVC